MKVARTGLCSLCLVILLAACNLQQGDPTPTLAVTPVTPEASVPPSHTPAQATLRPTPTMLPLASLAAPTTQPGQPTVIPLGAGTPGMLLPNALTPTLNPTDADQRYEVTVRDGATIGVNYAVTLETGTLAFTLQGPDGVLWQKTLTASETSRAEVTVQRGGVYEILVQIDRFDGNYSVSWD